MSRPEENEDRIIAESVQNEKSALSRGVDSGLSFVALDVETANRDRASICAIGAVRVIDGEIAEQKRWLCKPPPGIDDFEPINIGVHGLRPSDVADSPDLRSVLGELVEFVGDLRVLAHNAAFDIGALRRASVACGAPCPELVYGCTMAMTRSMVSLPSYRLDWCAAEFDVPLTHHDPLSDAQAAAVLASRLMDRFGMKSLDELMSRSYLRWGRLTHADGETAMAVTAGGRRPPAVADSSADSSHPLYGSHVCITGDLVVMTRAEAFERLASVGAQGQANVNGKTTMVVVGMLNPAVLAPGATLSGKAKRALELLKSGQQIEIIEAFDFLALLDWSA